MAKKRIGILTGGGDVPGVGRSTALGMAARRIETQWEGGAGGGHRGQGARRSLRLPATVSRANDGDAAVDLGSNAVDSAP